MKTVKSALSYKVQNVWVEGMPDGAKVQAYVPDGKWNGFLQPVFPMMSGVQLVTMIPELRYDATRDAFLSEDDDNAGFGDGDLQFDAQEIVINGREIKVYPIGTGYWTWHPAD